MSTIPKEIKDKINYACIEYSCFIAARESYAFGAEYGYQLATDGREELEKEKTELLLLSQKYAELITALQSQCTEKDQEIEGYKKEYLILFLEDKLKQQELKELKAENERLKGLIDDLLETGYSGLEHEHEKKEFIEKFKTENQL